MFFSDYFKVNPEVILAYGAINISLVCDIPLFIDPMLIFNSEKPDYKELHKKIIKYFHFLYTKAQNGLSKNEIKAWFSFNEIKHNWLGYSLEGNKGSALGWKYSEFLYENIAFAINTHGISSSSHIEKVMLLYEGSGKDKISDLTVNLIKEFLLEYTEKFALEFIQPELCKKIYVDKAYFNYKTESFISKEYTLPFIIDKQGKVEYVLLTPFDILREDEPSINRNDLLNSHERIRNSIDNDILRAFVNNYIAQAVMEYEITQKRNKKPIKESSINKIEKKAFKEIIAEYPELYDYYIKLRESDTDEIKFLCLKELNYQLAKLLINSTELINSMVLNGYYINESLTAREEAKNRLKYFKHIIEDCDGYRNLYTNGIRIANEKDLQRLFKLVWYGIVSKNQYNQNIIEFKLASNSTLNHVFEQVKIYETANCTNGSLIAIFYFTEAEYIFAKNIVAAAGYENKIDDSIFLIDCRNDNKPSASVA